MVNLLESIKRSYKQIKKVLSDKKKIITLEKLIVRQLICLLRPFKHIIIIVQKGREPTLHLVTLAILTLRDTLNTHEALVEYSENYEMDSSPHEVDEDEEIIEDTEGITTQNT